MACKVSIFGNHYIWMARINYLTVNSNVHCISYDMKRRHVKNSIIQLCERKSKKKIVKIIRHYDVFWVTVLVMMLFVFISLILCNCLKFSSSPPFQRLYVLIFKISSALSSVLNVQDNFATSPITYEIEAIKIQFYDVARLMLHSARRLILSLITIFNRKDSIDTEEGNRTETNMLKE